MDGGDRRTHDTAVSAARQALVVRLGIEGTDLAETFLASPIGHRTRASSVRLQLARAALEQLTLVEPTLCFGAFLDVSDELVIHRPTTLPVRADLQLPVLSALPLKLTPFVHDLIARGAASLGAELAARGCPEAIEATRRLQTTPPAFDGWTLVAAPDVARSFEANPPLLQDRRELYHRIRLASTYALDRTRFETLAERNPGFVDYLQCFPLARSLRRKVIAWLGPTNSGKTHRAIRLLRDARNGMYLGPLRLLALEQRDRLVELGCPCSLITGEERDRTSTTHSARTVEMTDFGEQFEVVVLDEMQLAFDRDRGWAWVAAYCGAAAETLIVTGPVSAEAVIRRLATVCGDSVEVNTVERQGTLAYEGVLDWRHVPPRSAVIGFSRAMVLELKAMFESRGLRVSVIYGGLTPEVRRAEARRFRDEESDIVCATDAIGLGLNLPLDRVIFYEVDKFDGVANRALTSGELLQIAGRAGRGPGSSGWVAAFSSRDGRRVANALAQPQEMPSLELLPAAPTSMHIRAIADHLGTETLTTILEFFRTRLTFPGGTFFPDVQDDVVAIAELVDTYASAFPAEKRYALACAPIDVDEHFFRGAYSEWLETLAAGRPVRFPRRLETGGGLEALEETLKLLGVYRWLALKFPTAFDDTDYVNRLRRDATEQTQAILRSNAPKRTLTRRECIHCGRALLPSSPHRICRECHQEHPE